jgi:hypothetical protein
MKTQNRVIALCFIFAGSVVLLTCGSYAPGYVEPFAHGAVLKSCAARPELEHAVRELSSKQTHRELEVARLRLVNTARLSTTCRAEVISSIIKTMDKPQLDVYRDFNLWRYGANLLGDLKASEGLDLLIRNLSFTDDSSINLTHYPAMEGVIKIGLPAIPKLAVALRQSSDITYRYNAVFCIAQIGGPEAIQELRTAISSERDSCVRNFMQVSIDVLNNPRAVGKINPEDHNKWLAALTCQE